MFRLFLFAIVATTFLYAIVGANPPRPGGKVITGKITYAGSSAIAANTIIEIELRDISMMDAPAVRIDSTSISDAKRFPVSYELRYHPSDIKSSNSYEVSVRIEGPGNKLLLLNSVKTSGALLTGPKPAVVDIAVISTEGSPKQTNTIKPRSIGKNCAPVKCPGDKKKQCPYGFEKKDGCEICKCNDPCNPSGKAVLCGSKQRCHVDKKADGTFKTRCDAPGTKSAEGKPKAAPVSKAACKEPMLVGDCRAAFTRFFYNPETKSCETFTYGGCNGNANKFDTQEECEKLCKA